VCAAVLILVVEPLSRDVSERLAMPAFERTILSPQQVLATEASVSFVLGFIPDTQVQQALAYEWRSNQDCVPEERWKDLKATVVCVVDTAITTSHTTTQPHRDLLLLWADLLFAMHKLKESKKHKVKSASTLDPIASIAFTYTYPRFDTHVTAATNHLLKSPFCVHPGTGMVWRAHSPH
jgi:hypothetical protein